MKLKFAVTLLSVASIVSSGPAAASDDFVKGLIGGMIGGAITGAAQGQNSNRSRSVTTSSPKRSSISSAQRQENKSIQQALNYFGYNAGTPDGVLGSKTRAAASLYQQCLGYPSTGQMTPFEKEFLLNSFNRAQAGGQQTLALVASFPNAYCGLLQMYRTEMASGGAGSMGNQFVNVGSNSNANAFSSVVPNDNRQAGLPTGVATLNVNTTVQQQPSAEVAQLQTQLNAISDQISLLSDIIEHQETLERNDSNARKISAVEDRITVLAKQQVEVTQAAEQKYSVPIRPTNANLGTTALRASEIFPKVPYYIPGTAQTGEFWVEPRITDEGRLIYNFKFLDPDAVLATVVEAIQMTPPDVNKTIAGLAKVDEWTLLAQEKNIRRRFEKSAICFPASDCEEKVVGNSSTEVVFLTYEDGSTAGQIRRNKGPSSAGYNLSNEAALLLSAYLEYIVDVGSKEFNATTMTDEDLSEIFQ